jgi:hypothetical protein
VPIAGAPSWDHLYHALVHRVPYQAKCFPTFSHLLCKLFLRKASNSLQALQLAWLAHLVAHRQSPAQVEALPLWDLGSRSVVQEAPVSAVVQDFSSS